MSRKSLLIGYGNSLRGDDGIGQVIAQAFGREAATYCCDVIVCHQLTPELAENIAAVDVVVFVDAAVDIHPGAVVVRAIQAASAPSSGLVHTADPAALLDLAQKLYSRLPRAFLITVGVDVGSMALGEGLSDTAAAALPEAVAAVRRLLRQHQREG